MLTDDILIESNIAEISVTYSHIVPIKDRIKIVNHSHAFKVFRFVWDEETIELYETFMVILLNRNNRLLGVVTLSKGGMSGTVADIKLLFGIVLKAAAHCIVLCHNHPSGNVNPSELDIRLTKKIKNAREILEIALLDHLIITKDDYYSFLEYNLI